MVPAKKFKVLSIHEIKKKEVNKLTDKLRPNKAFLFIECLIYMLNRLFLIILVVSSQRLVKYV